MHLTKTWFPIVISTWSSKKLQWMKKSRNLNRSETPTEEPLPHDGYTIPGFSEQFLFIYILILIWI